MLQNRAVAVGDDSKFADVQVSLAPFNGDLANFDFDLSFSKEDVGASSNNIGYSGYGRYDGQDFTFNGPVAEVKMYYALDKKFNHDHKYESLVWVEQPFRMTINEADFKVEGADLTAEAKSEIVTKLTDSLIKYKLEIQDAKKEIIG